MDGFQVCEQLRNDPSLAATRSIALTGYADAEHRRRAAEAGFEHYLVKPDFLVELLTLLTSMQAADP